MIHRYTVFCYLGKMSNVCWSLTARDYNIYINSDLSSFTSPQCAIIHTNGACIFSNLSNYPVIGKCNHSPNILEMLVRTFLL
jgi:hypothetical protein